MLAQRTGWPVVLIVDVRGQAVGRGACRWMGWRGIAAMCLTWPADFQSRFHGPRMVWTPRALPIPVLGAVPRCDARACDTRASCPRLGAGARACRSRYVSSTRAARRIAAGVDLAGVAGPGARSSPAPRRRTAPGRPSTPLGQRIALARDEPSPLPAAVIPSSPTLARARRRDRAASHPLQDDAPAPRATRSTCPAAIPSCTSRPPDRQHPRSRHGLRDAAPRVARPFSASAAATWSWARGWWTRTGRATPWPACCRWKPSFACAALHLGYREVALEADTPLGRAGTRFRGP